MSSPEANKPPADADRYRTLLEASCKLSATLRADELYEAIYDETAAALEAWGFYLTLHDQSRDLARIVFYADKGQGKRVDLSYRGSDSAVFRTQQGSLANDDLEDGSLLLLGDDDTELARSAVTAPLMHNGRLIGAISAQSYEQDAYSEDDLELLQGIADVAAVGIHNSTQFTELERRRLEAEQLEEIGRALTRRARPGGGTRQGHLRRAGGTERRRHGHLALWGRWRPRLSGCQLRRVTERVATDETLKKFGISLSAGVAEFDPRTMASVNDVLRAADADMYEEKAKRREEKKAAR